MRKEKGITLIALIITIIIMLILAGVVINLAIGKNGLFKTAKQAAKNYTNAEAKELADLNNITNVVDQAVNAETEENNPETPTTTIDINSLKAGDYIKYDSGANGEILCRVLYPMNSKYGFQIVSDKSVKSIILGSKDCSLAVESYNNAIEILNNEAEAYINTKYAYDARCIGSLPTVENGMFIKKNFGATEYRRPNFEHSDFIDCLDEYWSYREDKDQMKNAGINDWNEEQGYWLAGRSVVSYDSYFYVSVVCTTSEWNTLSQQMYIVWDDGTSSSYELTNGLRPCISLKSNIIKITSGDGKSADTAYVIGK